MSDGDGTSLHALFRPPETVFTLIACRGCTDDKFATSKTSSPTTRNLRLTLCPGFVPNDEVTRYSNDPSNNLAEEVNSRISGGDSANTLLMDHPSFPSQNVFVFRERRRMIHKQHSQWYVWVILIVATLPE